MPRIPKLEPQRGTRGRGIVSLPPEGRGGPTPQWPLSEGATAVEWEAWVMLWATPHAVAWERLGWTRTVARYCRSMVAAEETGRSAPLLNAVTAMEDRLGLTPKAMRMLMWTIAPDEVGEKRQDVNVADGVRARIKAVG